MTGEQFRLWRQWMAFTQAEAGRALGYTARQIQHYELGHAPVPKAVSLACYALSVGVESYAGPVAPHPSRELRA